MIRPTVHPTVEIVEKKVSVGTVAFKIQQILFYSELEETDHITQMLTRKHTVLMTGVWLVKV